MVHPKFIPKSTPSRGPIAKPENLPDPWTRPTYDAKRHQDPIRRFSTITAAEHTDRPTERSRESSMSVRERRGLIKALGVRFFKHNVVIII